MKISEALDNYFPGLAKMAELKADLIAVCSINKFEAGTVILRQGEYVKVIPLLISGLAKVFKVEPVNGSEVLLYYIKPGESCVMSVTTLTRNEVSQVRAVIENDAEVLLIPADKALTIAKKHPKWNEFIYDLFDHKFEELLTVIEILTFSHKDKRLLEYLRKEARLNENTIIKSTHQHIADDLGSSREVISRLLKKLEHEGLIILRQGTVEIIEN